MTKRILGKVKVDNLEEIIEKELIKQIQSGGLYKHTGKNSMEINYKGLAKSIADEINRQELR